MFSFSHVYPTSLYKEGRKPRNVRTRILGFVHPDHVLYLVMTSHQTEILLLGKDGKSQTVLAFNRYIEIICADISCDFNLLIYTERIPNGTRFSFKSVMYHIHSFADIKAFEDNSPITSFFLPDINNYSSQANPTKNEYLFVNIIGNRIAYFRATFANKKLQIKQERLALNLTNCRSFYYNINRNHRLICAVTRNNTAYFFSFGKNRYFYHTSCKLTSYETINFNKLDLFNLSKSNNFTSNTQNKGGGFSIFGFSKEKNTNNVKFDSKENIPNSITPESAIKLMNKYSVLPPELALLPSVPSNHPFFRFSYGNMYVIPLIPLTLNANLESGSGINSIEANSSSSPSSFCKDFAIIEQLYRGEEFPLAFTITIAELGYSRMIEVPNVQPDVPINFISYNNVVFAFVLNSFVSMIDFLTYPPSIYFLPRCLCQGPLLEDNQNQNSDNQKTTYCCDISSTSGNYIVDMESGEIYNITISLKDNIQKLNLNFSDRKILKIFATLIARIPNSISISYIFNKLPMNEIGTVIYFFHVVFQIGLALDLNGKQKSSSSSSTSTQQKQTRPQPKSSPAVTSAKVSRKLSLQSSTNPRQLFNHDQSLSSSSSASGGISLASFDDSSAKNNSFFYPQNQSQIQVQNFSYNVANSHNSNKPKVKHYGRTVHDLADMRPPLSSSQLDRLVEIGREFPSMGKFTRVDSFLYLLYQFRSLNVREREVPDLAIRHLNLQSNFSQLIEASLFEWYRLYTPDDATRFILNTVVISEAIKNSAPSISCLEIEVETKADLICPQTIRNHLRYSAKLFGISGVKSVIDNSRKRRQSKRKSSVNISFDSTCLSNSTNSFSPKQPHSTSIMLKRKSLGGSATTFSSNRPARGKRNSFSSFPATIQSKTIQIKKGNSSSNFFKQMRYIESKNKEKNHQNDANIHQKSYDPQTLCNALKTREELELKYWSARLPIEFRDIFGSKNGSDSDSSIFGTSVALSKLTESQWSRADTTFGSDGVDD